MIEGWVIVKGNLSCKTTIIDNSNFEVIPWDINNLKPEILLFIKISEQKIDIIPKDKFSPEEKLKWKGKQISLVENAQRKHRLRFDSNSINVDRKVDDLTEKSISHFLDGISILKKWSIDYPDDYEKFIKIVSLVEEQVVEECMFPNKDNNELYKRFAFLLMEKIKSSFPFIEDTLVQNLCNQVMADWILRCPINFE